MKKRLVILLSVLIAAGAMFSPAAKAIRLEVDVGDRDYYEGPEFWDWGWHYVWVRGHWDHHHHWVRGYYERHGEWNHRHLETHHRWHEHHDSGHGHDHDYDHDHH